LFVWSSDASCEGRRWPPCTTTNNNNNNNKRRGKDGRAVGETGGAYACARCSAVRRGRREQNPRPTSTVLLVHGWFCLGLWMILRWFMDDFVLAYGWFSVSLGIFLCCFVDRFVLVHGWFFPCFVDDWIWV
jgi:hypothetical protein